MINPITAIQIGLLLYGSGKFIYHRLTDDEPSRYPEDQLQIPLAAEGTPYPLIYGRCRVRAPAIVWYGNISGVESPYVTGLYFYEGDILFIVGIPFADGVTLLQGIFIGDKDIDNAGVPDDFAPNPGNPGSSNVVASLPSTNPEFTQLHYEFMDGNSLQDFSTTEAVSRMVAAGVDATLIPSFRGYVTMLGRISRNQPNLPAIGFEISSYPSPALHHATVGLEANPADVLRDLLIGTFGKLGTDWLEYESFRSAAETLYAEGHGYSRAIESRRAAGDIIQEILRQIDGVLYEDAATGLWNLKLIRADFNPATIPLITVNNCERLDFSEAGGWGSVANRVRVVFSDRSQGYRDGSATAQNQANAVNQGEADEIVLSFPGVCTQGLASRIAARELAARSRPLMRCTATVDRTFWGISPGAAVALTWPEYGISGRVFRVASVGLGRSDDASMVLELVEDFFYTHRYEVTDAGGLPADVGGLVG